MNKRNEMKNKRQTRNIELCLNHIGLWIADIVIATSFCFMCELKMKTNMCKKCKNSFNDFILSSYTVRGTVFKRLPIQAHVQEGQVYIGMLYTQ